MSRWWVVVASCCRWRIDRGDTSPPGCAGHRYSIIKQAVELDKTDSDIHRWCA